MELLDVAGNPMTTFSFKPSPHAPRPREARAHREPAVSRAAVLRGFPLWLATAHSAGAACLFMATVALNRALRPTA